MSGVFSRFKPSLQRQWGIIDGLALSVVSVLAPQLLFTHVLAHLVVLLPLTENHFIFTANILCGIATIGLVLLFVHYYGQAPQKIGFKKIAPLAGIQAVLGGFFVYFALVTLLVPYILQLFSLDVNQPQDLGYANPGALDLLLVFISLVIVAPLVEEIVFRGFLFTGFRHQLTFWPAAVFISVIFGVVHGQWNVGFDVFFLSLVLCWLRERTDSLWPAIGLHALKNGIAFYLVYLYNGS